MKNFLKKVFGVSLVFMPLFVSADIASSTLVVPVHVSPLNNAALTTSSFTSVDWTDTFVGTSTIPAFYYYELSQGTSTNVEGGFAMPHATSSLLASSTMITVGTAEGTYYWHVRSADAFGNKGLWSMPWKVVIDNTAPTKPSNLLITASSAPVIIGTTTSNGYQTWLFSPSFDNGSGISKYQYNVSGSSTWFDNGLVTSFTTALGVGSYSVSVRALDRSGNSSTSTVVSLTVTASSTSVTTAPPVSTPFTIGQCKKGGWKTFSSPSFKNQGKCVSYIEKMLRNQKKADHQSRLDAKKKHEEEREMSKRHEDERKNNVALVIERANDDRDISTASTSSKERGSDNKNNLEKQEKDSTKGNKKNH